MAYGRTQIERQKESTFWRKGCKQDNKKVNDSTVSEYVAHNDDVRVLMHSLWFTSIPLLGSFVFVQHLILKGHCN